MAPPRLVVGLGAKVPFAVPLVLICATATSILSTDLFTPSLPHLPAYFSSDAETVQLTMSLNLFGFAIAQLIFGPLSDRFGRRPVLLLGMFGFLFFTLACGLAQSIGMLIAGRLFQGIMACSEAVIALAVIREVYDDDEAVKVLAIYGMVVALAPAVGPLIGGIVHVWLGWRANFWLVAGLIALTLAAIWHILPETTTPDPKALYWRRLLAEVAALLRRRNYMTNALLMSVTLGALFAFITDAPFVFIDQMGVATEVYGYYYGLVVFSYFLGSLFASRAAGRWGIAGILRVGLIFACLGGASFPVMLWLGLQSPINLCLVMSVYIFGQAFIFSTAPVLALSGPAGGLGLASALLGTLEMLGAALGALAVGVFHDGTAWPLAVTVAVGGTLPLAIYCVMQAWPVTR